RVNRLVLVRCLAEERNHPLTDSILSGVAEPVRDTCAGNRSSKTIRLCHGPHRHEATIAPTLDAESVAVNRIASDYFVYTCHDVAQITPTEILHVRASEGFTL